MAWWCMCVFMNCGLLFPAFRRWPIFYSVFSSKKNGSIFCSSSGFRYKSLYIKWWKMSKSVSSLILSFFLKLRKHNSCLLFHMLYLAPSSQASLCFCQITHLIISKPTAFSLFQLVWHFSGLAFFCKWFGNFCSLGPGHPGFEWVVLWSYLYIAQVGLHHWCCHVYEFNLWVLVRHSDIVHYVWVTVIFDCSNTTMFHMCDWKISSVNRLNWQ